MCCYTDEGPNILAVQIFRDRTMSSVASEMAGPFMPRGFFSWQVPVYSWTRTRTRPWQNKGQEQYKVQCQYKKEMQDKNKTTYKARRKQEHRTPLVSQTKTKSHLADWPGLRSQGYIIFVGLVMLRKRGHAPSWCVNSFLEQWMCCACVYVYALAGVFELVIACFVYVYVFMYVQVTVNACTDLCAHVSVFACMWLWMHAYICAS